MTCLPAVTHFYPSRLLPFATNARFSSPPTSLSTLLLTPFTLTCTYSRPLFLLSFLVHILSKLLHPCLTPAPYSCSSHRLSFRPSVTVPPSLSPSPFSCCLLHQYPLAYACTPQFIFTPGLPSCFLFSQPHFPSYLFDAAQQFPVILSTSCHHSCQVSMAVLLDNFLSASTAMEREERREEQGNAKLQTARDSGLYLLPLEPLLLKLTRDYVDSTDLDDRLASLYQVLTLSESSTQPTDSSAPRNLLSPSIPSPSPLSPAPTIFPSLGLHQALYCKISPFPYSQGSKSRLSALVPQHRFTTVFDQFFSRSWTLKARVAWMPSRFPTECANWCANRIACGNGGAGGGAAAARWKMNAEAESVHLPSLPTAQTEDSS